jgi:tetratricopeptide (TPR) repeat protein
LSDRRGGHDTRWTEWWERHPELDDLWRQRRLDEASTLIAEARQREPKHPAIALVEAYQLQLEQRGQTLRDDVVETVARLVDEAMVELDGDPHASVEAMVLMFNIHKLSEAFRYGKAVVPHFDELTPPERGLVHLVFGSILLKRDNPEAAEEQMLAAVENDADNPLLVEGLVRSQLAQGNTRAAIERLESAVQRWPDNACLRDLRTAALSASRTGATDVRWRWPRGEPTVAWSPPPATATTRTPSGLRPS